MPRIELHHRPNIIAIAADALATMLKEPHNIHPRELTDEKKVVVWLKHHSIPGVQEFLDRPSLLPQAKTLWNKGEFIPTNNIELLAGTIVMMFCQGDTYLDNVS
jgi:hypothetical protein